MALRLFAHNEKAYRAAVRMMDQCGKAAIVHPTGTGKSYIAFKLIEDNPEKIVIWFSPSEYIFKTQLESLQKNDPDFPLENVHFYTYTKLMCCTQAQLEKIAAQMPAYIILDEFHRAGAECWGESAVALLKLCLDAKLLGLTATNIRHLDNNRDMAEELFDGHIASEMTLGEAIVRGILPAPKYVTTVYQYQKMLAKYQARVDNLRTPGGYNLGTWVKRQRYTRQNPEKSCAVLTEERIARLDAIGMRWGKSDPWQYRYELAREYKKEHGNLDIPAKYKTADDIWLSRWIYEQERLLQSGSEKLNEKQKQQLRALFGTIGLVANCVKETAQAG